MTTTMKRAKPPRGRRSSDDEKHPTQDAATAEAAAKIRSLKESLGISGGTASVFRTATGQKPKYLGKIGIDELLADPHDVVKARFGGGDYQLTLIDGDHKYVPGGSVQLSIGGPPAPEPDKFDELEKRWNERITTAARPDTSSTELFRFMFETMREQLREIRTPPAAAAQANPMEMAVAMVSTIQAANAPILEALLARTNREPRERNRLEELRELVELFTLFQGMGGDKPRGMDAIIEKLATPLGQFFERAAPTGAPGAPLPLPPGDPRPVAPPAKANGVPRPEWYPMIERAIPSMLSWARSGKDPELRADLVVEDLPDNMLGPIHEQLQREGFLGEFVANVPEAGPLQAWFGEFFGRIRQALDDMWVEEGAAAATETSIDEPEKSSAPSIEQPGAPH
ncbi:MAG: hypothetical protein AB7T31_15050 [Gemmatimonadales bacterium]